MKTADSRFRKTLNSILEYMPNADTELLERAFRQSIAWRDRLKDEVGVENPNHPVEVLEVAARLKMDQVGLITALVHDAMENDLATQEEVRQQFGESVSCLVANVSILSRHPYKTTKRAEQVKSFRKMFLAMASDIRVILVKLADRLVLMRSLEDSPDPEAHKNIALETLEIYTPITSRLGIGWLKVEFENLAFRFLYPVEYGKVDCYVVEQRAEHQDHVDMMVADIRDLMTENKIDVTVYGRTKHHYSIFRKMERKTLEIDQLYDIFAYRIIVKSLGDCYRALGLVHTSWRPIQGMFEDYVATPKPNGYQSLHTIVVGDYGERTEIQIRTEEMHEVAENGIASHWQYKESGRATQSDEIEQRQVNWLRRLLEVSRDTERGGSLLDSLSTDLFSDYIYVFSPMGDVHELPRDSRPVDFAFSVHTQVGLHCQGAKVGGRIIPLRSKLRNGDVVEILTSKRQHPKKEWLEFVKTGRARTKIRHAVRKEEREKSREIGRELLEREFKRIGLNFNKMVKSGRFAEHLKKLRARSVDELMIKLGRGQVNISDVFAEVAPEKAKELEPPKPEKQKPPKQKRRQSKSGLRISGLDDILVRFAKCCKPIQGDPVVGFVTRGRGVTIHRQNCNKFPRNETERILDAYWDQDEEYELPVRLKIISNGRTGLLNSISSVFASNGINVISASINTGGDRSAGYFLAQFKNLAELEYIRRQLARLKGVRRVERVVESH